MIEIYKHFNVYDRSSLHKTFQHQMRVTRNHEHELQLVERIPKDGVRGAQFNSFYYRTINPWNNLPADVVKSETMFQFRVNLDEAWKERPQRLQQPNGIEETFGIPDLT
eukprot:TCONS_00041732-protein